MRLLKKDNILKISAWVCFISLIFQIVNGLWPQISMLLFNGKVLFPNIVFKLIFIISIFVICYIKKEIIKDKKILKFFYIFIVYVVFEFLYFKFYYNYSFKYILFGLNTKFFYLFFIPIAINLRNILNKNKLFNILSFLFILIVLLGLAQYILNSSVLPVKSLEGYYEAISINFQDRIRVHSLFSFPFDFVFFISFFLIFYLFTHNIRKIYYLLAFIAVYLFMTYISYLRTAYLFSFSVLISLLLYEFNLFDKYSRKLPAFNFLLGLLITLILSFYSLRSYNPFQVELYNKNVLIDSRNKIDSILNNKNGDIFDLGTHYNNKKVSPLNLNSKVKVNIHSPDSMMMRLIQWRDYLLIYKSNILYILFGTGIYGSRVQNLEFAIDNFFIDILFYSGILGLIIVLIFIYQIYIFMINNFSEINVFKSLLIIYPTFFLTGFYDEQFLPIYLSYSFLSFFFLDKVYNVKL